jgi:hypothetical protein
MGAFVISKSTVNTWMSGTGMINTDPHIRSQGGTVYLTTLATVSFTKRVDLTRQGPPSFRLYNPKRST